MATTTRVDVEAYLHTVYEPDAEYIDGEIEERHVGEYEHNRLQLALVNWFLRRGKLWQVRSIQEQRTRLTSARYRIPDVSVFHRHLPIEPVFTQPQLIAIEVLSPEDRSARVGERILDFIRFGVLNIWIFDPQTRHGWDCSTGEWLRCERFEVAGTPIYLSLPELFAEIDAEEA